MCCEDVDWPSSEDWAPWKIIVWSAGSEEEGEVSPSTKEEGKVRPPTKGLSTQGSADDPRIWWP